MTEIGQPRCNTKDTVPCQVKILEICRKCGGFELNPGIVKFCPRCLPAFGKQAELRLETDAKTQADELFCDTCRFRCWNRNYYFYRSVVQRFLCSGDHEEKITVKGERCKRKKGSRRCSNLIAAGKCPVGKHKNPNARCNSRFSKLTSA